MNSLNDYTSVNSASRFPFRAFHGRSMTGTVTFRSVKSAKISLILLSHNFTLLQRLMIVISIEKSELFVEVW